MFCWLSATFEDLRANSEECQQRIASRKSHTICFHLNSFKQWDNEICKETTYLSWMQSCYQVTLVLCCRFQIYALNRYSLQGPNHFTVFSPCSGASQTLCSHCKGREAELYCKTVASGIRLDNLKWFSILKHNVSKLSIDRSKLWHLQYLTWRCSLGGYGRSARNAKDLCTRMFSAQGLLFLPFDTRSSNMFHSHALDMFTQKAQNPFLCNHDSRDCPIFYRRRKAQKDMAEARLQLDRWDF